MKINITNILLGILVAILLWVNFINPKEVKTPEPVTINIPENKGTASGVIKEYVPYPVYIKSENKNIEVDNYWKNKYENTKDSVERAELYYKAIAINKYDTLVVSNDTTKINLKAITRGELLSYDIDYKYTPKPVTYTPDIITKLPRLSGRISVEGGVPTIPETGFLLKGNLGLENDKGNGLSLGLDTDKRVWLGISKTFKIIK